MRDDAPNTDPPRGGETTRPAAGKAPAHDASVPGVERMAAVVHEIGNLVDGSLRCVRLAKQSLELAAAAQPAALRQLETAASALERMAGIVHAAMQGPSLPIGSVMIAGAEPVCMRDAVAHALEVLRPLAELNRVDVGVEFAPGLGDMPAGALYTVVLNGVRNAIESIGRRGSEGGRVDLVVAGVDRPPWWSVRKADWIEIRVTDDGIGFANAEEAEQAFLHGVSSKRNGLGIGLALAREIVQEMGGRIELVPRPPSRATGRTGAMLRVFTPAQIRPTAFIGRHA